MPYSKLQDLPEDLRDSVNAALEIEFANEARGTWRSVADRVNFLFDTAFDGEFVRDIYRRRHRSKNKSADAMVAEPVVYDVDTEVDELTSLRAQVVNFKSINQRLFGQLQAAKHRSEDLVEAAT